MHVASTIFLHLSSVYVLTLLLVSTVAHVASVYAVKFMDVGAATESGSRSAPGAAAANGSAISAASLNMVAGCGAARVAVQHEWRRCRVEREV